MNARQPTILATSGGYRTPDHGDREFTPLMQYAAVLAGAEGRPKFCHLGTANGDQRYMAGVMSEAAHKAGFDWVNLNLFAEPTFPDLEDVLLSQDVIWVNGGSVVNLLAVWRAHGLDAILRRAWLAGVVLAGISAGSLCWFQGGRQIPSGRHCERSGTGSRFCRTATAFTTTAKLTVARRYTQT